MSVSSIIDQTTGKIYDDLIPQGGGIPLPKGGLITAVAGGQEQPLPPGNNGWVLSANSNVNLGLEYIQLPAGGIAFQQEGQLLYAGAGPAFADSLLNIGNAGQILGINAGIPAWINAGGSGTITALAPLTEYADGTASEIAINFTGKGDLVVGGGVQVGGKPIAGVILPVGANDMVLSANSGTPSGLEWVAQGGGSSATIFRNSSNNQPQLITKPATANDTLVITSDRVFNTGSTQIYNQATVGAPSNPLPVQGAPGPPLTIYAYTPASAETLTSYQSQIYWFSNALNSLFWKLSVFDSTNTTELIVGGLTPVGNTNVGGEYFNFGGSGNLALAGGTTYNFALVRTGASGDQFQLADVVVGFSIQNTGNITVNTTNFTGVATFTCPPGSKFRQYQSPTNLAGFQSATLQDYTAQSYVSSGDTNDWIAIGNGNAGVAYIA